MLAVCAGGTSSGPLVAGHPGVITDLAVAATTEISAQLSFTQVDDGMSQPAKYDVRYSAGSMSWGSATSAAIGTCATPVAGTGVGTTLSCTVLGLSPSTGYDFQVVAFRGEMNGSSVFGELSNVAAASTLSITQPNQVVTTVTVAPASASLGIGGTSTLQATVKDQNGTVMTGQTLTWTTSNSAAATVSSSGVVTGVAAGSATITATSSGITGTSSVTVTAGPPPAPVVTTVAVAPTSASVVAGATTTLQATVKDQNGNVMTGQTVTWTTSNAAAATVSASGVVTGVAVGSATITATSSGKTGTSSITVTASPPPAPVVTTVTVAPTSASVIAGATTTLQATVKDQNGNVMTGQTVTWTTSNAAAATVSASGVVTGAAAGSATITATSSGKMGTSAITVTAPSGGGTILFQENFEDTNLASRGWYDNATAVLSTTEHIAGSNSSAQYRFLPGASTPTVGGAQRHKFTPSNSFYVSYYVKYSANWVGSNLPYHPHEFYAMSTLDGDFAGPSQNFLTVYVEQNYLNGGRPRVAMQDNLSVNTTLGALPNNLIATTENRSTGGCNGVIEVNMPSECFNNGSFWYNDKQLTGPVMFQPSPGPGYKNDWNFVEAYFQLNTIVGGIGQADGVIQYWFNGALVIDRHDVLFRTGAHPTLQFSQFLIAPYIGDGSPVDQSMFVDNLRLATSRIP
ncbi:MAG: Ig-like domain-containing protein [Terriglobales bacterium]